MSIGWVNETCSGGHRRPCSVSGDPCVNNWGPMTRFVHGVFFHLGHWNSGLGSA